MSDSDAKPEQAAISDADRAEIDEVFDRLATADLYQLLGVAPGVDRRTVRDAYFRLSKRFHPDTYFGREMGPWKARVEAIFRELTRAYDVLGDARRRAEYDRSLGTVRSSEPPLALDDVREIPVDPRVRVSISGEHSIRLPTAATPSAPTLRPAPPARPPSPPPPAATSASVPPALDPEQAQRAAREALARKLRGGAPWSASTAPPQRPLASSSPPPASIPAPAMARTTPPSAPLASPDAPRILPQPSAVSATRAALGPAQLASLAAEHERAQRWRDAANAWQQAAALDERSPAYLLRAAQAYLHGALELPRAAQLARRAAQLDPRHVEAYLTLASVLLAAGKRESATAALETALRLAPTAPEVLALARRFGR